MQHGNRARNVEAAPLVNGQNSLRTGAAGYHAANVSVIESHHGGMPPTRCRPVTRIIDAVGNRLKLEVPAGRVGQLFVIGVDQVVGCHATGQCQPRSV